MSPSNGSPRRSGVAKRGSSNAERPAPPQVASEALERLHSIPFDEGFSFRLGDAIHWTERGSESWASPPPHEGPDKVVAIDGDRLTVERDGQPRAIASKSIVVLGIYASRNSRIIIAARRGRGRPRKYQDAAATKRASLERRGLKPVTVEVPSQFVEAIKKYARRLRSRGSA
jgi:hypothetical protein